MTGPAVTEHLHQVLTAVPLFTPISTGFEPYVFHEGGNIGQPLTHIRAHELVGYWSPKLDEQFRVVRYTP